VDVKSCRVTGKVEFYSPVWYELPFAPPLPKGAETPQSRVDALQKTFWQELISLTWTVSPTRGQLVKDYWINVLGTGWERRWKEWKKPSRRLRFLKAFATLRRVDPTQRWVGSIVDGLLLVGGPKIRDVLKSWLRVVLQRNWLSGSGKEVL